jgi:hypothetical protein
MKESGTLMPEFVSGMPKNDKGKPVEQPEDGRTNRAGEVVDIVTPGKVVIEGSNSIS